MEQRFEGKVIVVTGGAGGIGRAAAQRFACEGARVVVVDLPASPLGETVAAVEQAGGTALAVAADVTDADDVQRYAAETMNRFGRIDYLFNNAGIEGFVGSLLDCPDEAFDRVMAVNLRGVWLGLKYVGGLMREQGGAIVNTASITGLRGTPSMIAYSTSKHAVIGLTRTAALELARYQIRVNAVCPAPVETRMMRDIERVWNPADPEAAKARQLTTIPLRRYAQPAEIAGLVAFLCSADAAYITGGIYTIDGGWSA